MPWKCSGCKYISTRNWNTKSHIILRHGGTGNPIPVGSNRRASSTVSGIFRNSQKTGSKSGSYINTICPAEPNSNPILGLLSVDEDDRQMYEMLLEISDEFEELEQLLDKNGILSKNKLLGYVVGCAIANGDPKTLMREVVRVCKSKIVIDRMIECVSALSNRDLLNTKQLIKVLMDPVF